LPTVIEHVVNKHVKVVYVCGDRSSYAIGDLPALPWCFKCVDRVSLGDTYVCWSEDIRVNEMVLRVEASKVKGSLRSIQFILLNIDCGASPEEILNLVKKAISERCREAAVAR